MRSRILLAAALVAGTATTASAQLSITPFFGEMIPLKTLVNDTASGGGYYKFTPHTIYGLRFAKQMSPSLTLQLQTGIGKGQFEFLSSGTPVTIESSLYFVDARVRLRVLGNDAANLGVIGGAGWTQFQNGLFDIVHELDSGSKLAGRITGIVGLGAKGHLTGNTSFTADLTDRIHEQPIESSGLSTIPFKPTQHDLTATFGLNFPLGR